MIKSVQAGCKCTAMDLIFSPYILYSLSLWKQPLTVELKYLLLLLLVFVWPWFRSMLNLQNSLVEEKVRVACVLIKVTRLEWSLWKTESSVLHQPCFTVPQLFPFRDKWHFRSFQVELQSLKNGMSHAKGRWARRFCRSLCQCWDNSCKIKEFDLVNRKKTKHFSSSTVNQLI